MNSVITATPDKAVVESSFSEAAILYDRYADHHRLIAERLMDYAPPATVDGSILEIGCGTGILTEKLLDHYPESDVTVLDISPDMIDRCRLKLGPSGRLSFMVADAEEYCRWQKRYDMVVSSCSIQWFHDRNGLTDRLQNMLPSRGSCLMAIPVRGMLHELMESCVFGARKAVYQLDLDTGMEWRSRFENSGFKILSTSVESVSCVYSHPLEVLKAIRGIGACIEQGSACLNPGEMKRMTEYYRNHFKVDSFGGVSSTYRILYLLGRKL